MFNLFGKKQEKKSDFEIEDDDDEQGFFTSLLTHKSNQLLTDTVLMLPSPSRTFLRFCIFEIASSKLVAFNSVCGERGC